MKQNKVVLDKETIECINEYLTNHPYAITYKISRNGKTVTYRSLDDEETLTVAEVVELFGEK